MNKIETLSWHMDSVTKKEKTKRNGLMLKYIHQYLISN